MIKGNQAIMESIFPGWREFPKNSMTPALNISEDGKKMVSFLILASKELLQDFYNEPEEYVIFTTVYLRKNKQKVGQDLIIRFDFNYPNNISYFESVIQGNLGNSQILFCKALTEVQKLYVFAADNHGKVLKVKEVLWDCTQHKDIYKLV
ncbi:hypothetical protein RDV78_09775 [Bacillota bacterium LX-D]|nr:hypothetical protein [Bacillota bacterium LX-D]